jgi:hypothetical protein
MGRGSLKYRRYFDGLVGTADLLILLSNWG